MFHKNFWAKKAITFNFLWLRMEDYSAHPWRNITKGDDARKYETAIPGET
jgi:hypothetical protein